MECPAPPIRQPNKKMEDGDMPPAGKRRRKGRTKSNYILPDEFMSQYIMHEELGRGAFAIVYRCSLKTTREERAAKIIDLRPIRMRGSLNLDRVMREVNILKCISHPNIVKLVEVFSTRDTLVLIMEYIRGRELFFEILDRNHYSEEAARPIFLQLTSAISYLHSVSILHRDIKPENVLVIERSANNDPTAGIGDNADGGISTGPVVKLLDFGLSKLVDPGEGGSAAKTFVGTRAYLAPEVELRAHGQGGAYGCPADCWSLGAVLHVMLVAKFPSFDVVHKVTPKGTLTPFSGVLKVEGSVLWERLSPAVKDMIKGLMTPNPTRRLTAAEALQHPWSKGSTELPFGYARAASAPNGRIHTSSQQGNPPPNNPQAHTSHQDHMPPPQAPHHHNDTHVDSDPIGTAPVELRLGLLVKIQQWIAASLGVAFKLMLSSSSTEVASCVREGAVICRHELHLTVKLLRKVFETAGLVLGVFPDLELAICQGEQALAQSFFATIKSWLSEIRKEIRDIQKSNEDATTQMSVVIKRAAKELIAANKLISYREKEKHRVPGADGEGPELGQNNGEALKGNSTGYGPNGQDLDGTQQHGELDFLLPSVHCDESYPIDGEYDKKVEELAEVLNDLLPSEAIQPHQDAPNDPRQVQDRQMAQVVISLRRLDRILERLETFWARCEVDLQLMIQRGDHLKCLTMFAQTPDTVQRLHERLTEYKYFWCRVRDACTRYLTGVTDDTVAAMYAYLDDADVTLPNPDGIGKQQHAMGEMMSGGYTDGSAGSVDRSDFSGDSAFESNDEL